MMGLALCVCLATIFWCILLARRQHGGLDKVLIGLLGLIAIYDAIRILKDSGILFIPGLRILNGWPDFIIASLCLVAAMILKVSCTDRANIKVRLRLVEANEKTMDLGKNVASSVWEAATALSDASPLATFAVDAGGTVMYWNAAAEHLLGWNREEVLGHALPFAKDGLLLDKTGHEVAAAVWKAPIRASNGSSRGTLTIAADSSILRSAGIETVQLPSTIQLAVQN